MERSTCWGRITVRIPGPSRARICGQRGRLSLPQIVALTSYNAARLFGLYPRKGALDVGSDADLVVVDPDREVKVDLTALNSVVDFSPYEGYLAHGWAATTVAGGEVVYDGGEIVTGRRRGRYLPRTA